MNIKICSKCNQEKALDYFYKNKSRSDGLNYWCVECEKSSYVDEYDENARQRKKEYYTQNKEKILKKRKEYRKNNREKIKLQSKKSYKKHREKRIKEVGDYIKKRNRNDIQFRLKNNLRTRLRKAVKNDYKSGSAVQDLGCAIEEFKLWLEQQFYPHSETGEFMSWKNYGLFGWHIDHIVPLNLFDLTDRKQLKKACHWFNLRPLWAEENLSRG